MSLKYGGDYISMILSSCPAGRGAALLAGGGSQQEVGEGLRRAGCDIMLCLLLTSETVERPPSERQVLSDCCSRVGLCISRWRAAHVASSAIIFSK